MGDPESARAILEALHAYTAAQRTEPRDEQAIDAARTKLDELVEQRHAA